jgi:segregation and condensation protein B
LDVGSENEGGDGMIAKGMSNGQMENVELEVVAEPSTGSDSNGHHDESEIGELALDCSLDQQEIKSILESVLFVAHDPITLDRLTAVIEGPPRAMVFEALKTLQNEYEQEGRGLRLAEVAGGFLLVTRPEYAPYIKRLNKSKSITKLSRSALETLAIISYKQPIIRAEIEKIRGVETSGVLRTLLDQKLVRIVGRQEVPGRPILYGTSKQFLQRFGLMDLRDLPPLKEFQALGNPESLDLPFEGAPVPEGANGSMADLSA